MNNCKRIFISIFLSLLFVVALPTNAAEELKSSAVTIAAVNVNQASANEIATALTGVGLKRAQAIVDYRDQFGPFQSAEELLEVKGIGKATLEKNRSKLAF